MKRIILTLGLLVIVVSCARIEQNAQERRTPVAGSSPVSTQPTEIPLPTVTVISTAPTVAATPAEPTEIPAPPEAAATEMRGDFLKEIDVSGSKREYVLHVPATYKPTQPTSLVFSFHGHGGNGVQQAILSGLSKKADAENFIVVYPQGSRNPPQWGITAQGLGRADMQFVRAMVDELSKNYAIDPQRIYASGFSNGAEFSNLAACNMADIFAAVAVVANGYFRGLPCKPERPIPHLAFHGTDDNVLPFEGDRTGLLPVPEGVNEWVTRNGCTATPKVIYEKGDAKGELWGGCRENAEVALFTIDGGGHSWPGSPTLPRLLTTQDVNATDVMWLFFASHPKPQP